MEHLSGDHDVAELRNLCAAVDPVAENRITDMRHVHADLVSAAGLDLHLHEGRIFEALFDFVERDRLA